MVEYEYNTCNVPLEKQKSGGKLKTYNNRIISVTEGRFKFGKIDGFARQFNSEGECKIGYWNVIDLKFPKTYHE